VSSLPALALCLSLLLPSVSWATGEIERDGEIADAPDLADPSAWPPALPRQPDALNGKFAILNIHGLLFQDSLADVDEDLAYAQWLNAGIVRVFATDANHHAGWDGDRLAERIAEMAPALRASGIKLIVAIVNNHQEVPGEAPEASGWMDGYHQLLLPFYTDLWRGAYLSFTRSLVESVNRRGVRDVVFAWELGNELHTPREPRAVMTFINQAAAELRKLDPEARILAGTMGANHLEPGVQDSAIARALYCHGPISAYTLHTYDWLDEDNWGDMPIHWDFENIVNRPCANGRYLPVIVEELGTSRQLPGVYAADDEGRRFEQEMNQIRMVLKHDGVIGIGVWSAQSPRVQDISRFDYRRGLTSYGSDALGGGSCYRIDPDAPYGARCMLERVIQRLPALD
jgi:hypothetical protein